MKKIFILFSLIIVSMNLYSSIDFTAVDDLYVKDDIAQTQAILEKQLTQATNNVEKAEVYWRLARVQVSLGDKTENKDEKVNLFSKGLEYANKSIELNDNTNAHLWKSSNVGRIGQTKGVLNSLSAASDMRIDLRIIIDDFKAIDSSETWYVMGTLYTLVPGGIISFGDKNYGISYFRIAVDTIPNNVIYPNHYKELAIALYERNWDKNKRAKEFKKLNSSWNKTNKLYDKYAYYEGKESGKNVPYYSSVALTKMSDRQEAVMLLNYAIAKYNAWPSHNASEDEAIEEIKALKSQWT